MGGFHFQVKKDVWKLGVAIAIVLAIGGFWYYSTEVKGWDWVGNASAVVFILLGLIFLLRGKLR